MVLTGKVERPIAWTPVRCYLCDEARLNRANVVAVKHKGDTSVLRQSYILHKSYQYLKHTQNHGNVRRGDMC